MRLHTGSTPFACRLGCGASYMWMSSRKGHELNRCRFAAFIPPELNPSRRPSRYRRSVSGNAVGVSPAAVAAAAAAVAAGVVPTTTATTTTATANSSVSTAITSGDGVGKLGLQAQTASVVGNPVAEMTDNRHNQQQQHQRTHADATRTDDDGMNKITGKFDTHATTVGINKNSNAVANAVTTNTDRLTSSNSADNVTTAVPQGLLVQENQQHIESNYTHQNQQQHTNANYAQQHQYQPQPHHQQPYHHQSYHDQTQLEQTTRMPLQPHPQPQTYNNVNAVQVNVDHHQQGHAPIASPLSRIGGHNLPNLPMYNNSCESASTARAVANGLMVLPVSPMSPTAVVATGSGTEGVTTDGMASSSDRHKQDMMLMMMNMQEQQQQRHHHHHQQLQVHHQKYQQQQQNPQQQQQQQQRSLSLSSQALLPPTVAGTEGNANPLIPYNGKTQMPQHVEHEHSEGQQQRLVTQQQQHQQQQETTLSPPASVDYRRQTREDVVVQTRRARATSSSWMKAALEATAVQLMKSNSTTNDNTRCDPTVKQEPVCTTGTGNGGIVALGNETTATVIKVDDIQQQEQVHGDEVDMDMNMDMNMDMDMGLGMGTSGGGLNMDIGSMMMDKDKAMDGDGSSQVSDVTSSDAVTAADRQGSSIRNEAGNSKRNDSVYNKATTRHPTAAADDKTRTTATGKHVGRRRMMEEEEEGRWGETLDVNSRTSRWVLGGTTTVSMRSRGNTTAGGGGGGMDVLADVDLPDRDGFSEEFLEDLLC